MRKLMAFWLLSASLACGSGSTPRNHVNGTVSGKGLTARDAVYGQGSWKAFDPFPGTYALVALSEYTSSCGYFQKSQVQPNTVQLFLGLAKIDSTGLALPPTEAGEYLIPTSQSDLTTPNTLRSLAFWDVLDAQCGEASIVHAVTGKVTVSSVSAGHISGTFDITLQSSERLTGSFDAPACANMALNSGPYCP